MPLNSEGWMTVVDERSGAPRTRAAGFQEWARRRESVAVTVAAAFVLLAGSVLAVHAGAALKIADEQQYEAIAAHLADQGRYSLDGAGPTAYRPPVWPIVLAAFHAVGLGVVFARLFNVLCLAATVLGVWRLARRLGGPAAGVVGAAACAVYPTFLYAAATLYPQSLGTLLLVGAVLAAMNAVDALGGNRKRGLWFAAASGLSAGLTVLTIPVLSGPVLLLVAWLLVVARREALLLVGVTVAVAVLPVLAWTVRNEAALHTFVPVSTSDGVNLLLGNSEHAGPGTGTLTDISRYEAVVRDRGLDEVGQDSYYRSASETWIGDHPGSASVLYAEKALHYFAYQDQLAGSAQPSALQGAVLAASFLPVLGLVALRLVRAVRSRPLTRDEALLIGLFALSALFMAVFFTRVRFRLPLDALAIAVAAAAVVGTAGRRQNRHE